MKEIVNLIIWNPVDRRLRAFWRLFIEGFAWFNLVSIFTLIPLFLMWFAAVASSHVEAENPMSTVDLLVDLMYQPEGLFVIQTVTFLTTLMVVGLAGRFLDRRRFADFGFHFSRRWWLDLAFGLFLGAFLMTGIFLVESAAGWVSVAGFAVSSLSGVPFGLAILLPITMFVFVGISEELSSRGYQLKNLAEGFNSKAFGPMAAILAATILSSISFALLHAANPNVSVISVLNLIVAGVFLAAGYILTGELAISIGIHITWNFFQGNVFGFPVSGLEPVAARVIAIRETGPAFITGGLFGPEGGLIGLAAMALGIALIALWVILTRRKLALADSIAQYRKGTGPDDGIPESGTGR